LKGVERSEFGVSRLKVKYNEDDEDEDSDLDMSEMTKGKLRK
jgi:hypothetical protein